MELNFIGKGSAFTPQLKNTSAYFVINNDLFLLDCGESVFGEVWDLAELRECRNIYVLITHLHCDHVGSLGSLISYCYYILQKKIYVIHPVTTIVELLSLLGIEKITYHYTTCLPEEAQGITVEAVEVEHVNNMQCFGYLMNTDEDRIYYSGDAVKIPNKILEEFLKGKIDRVYQDTSIHSSEVPTHFDLEKLEIIIPLNKRDFVYCMHLDGDDENLYRERGFHTI
jgi:ribonuclease BN (tRNA processing enzyme)